MSPRYPKLQFPVVEERPRMRRQIDYFGKMPAWRRNPLGSPTSQGKRFSLTSTTRMRIRNYRVRVRRCDALGEIRDCGADTPGSLGRTTNLTRSQSTASWYACNSMPSYCRSSSRRLKFQVAKTSCSVSEVTCGAHGLVDQEFLTAMCQSRAVMQFFDGQLTHFCSGVDT